MFQLGCANRICFQNEILSGLTVALALVPEAVAFAFVAGVDPLVGLYAAFMVGLLAATFGGRPGMISGATGAMATRRGDGRGRGTPRAKRSRHRRAAPRARFPNDPSRAHPRRAGRAAAVHAGDSARPAGCRHIARLTGGPVPAAHTADAAMTDTAPTLENSKDSPTFTSMSEDVAAAQLPPLQLPHSSQGAQAPPPEPQAASVSPAWQALPSQQPVQHAPP